MKYVIDKNKKDLKLAKYNVNISGLNIRPINNLIDIKIKAEKIILIDDKLCNKYVKQKINYKINRVIKFMLRILNDNDTSDDDVGIVLNEIEKLKGIITNKYKEHMKINEYKTMLTKLILIEEEFKRNYNKMLFENIENAYIYEDRIKGGKSR